MRWVYSSGTLPGRAAADFIFATNSSIVSRGRFVKPKTAQCDIPRVLLKGRRAGGHSAKEQVVFHLFDVFRSIIHNYADTGVCVKLLKIQIRKRSTFGFEMLKSELQSQIFTFLSKIINTLGSGRRLYAARPANKTPGGTNDACRDKITYFDALIYLADRSQYPLQLVLRDILILANMPADVMAQLGDAKLEELSNAMELLKYSVIVVGSLPVLILYPFVQKYFVKGVMIGSVKG